LAPSTAIPYLASQGYSVVEARTSWYCEQFLRNLPQGIRFNLIPALVDLVGSGVTWLNETTKVFVWREDEALARTFLACKQKVLEKDAMQPPRTGQRVYWAYGDSSPIAESRLWPSRFPFGGYLAFIKRVDLGTAPPGLLLTTREPEVDVWYELSDHGTLIPRPKVSVTINVDWGESSKKEE
jgi:hypothetical protein